MNGWVYPIHSGVLLHLPSLVQPWSVFSCCFSYSIWPSASSVLLAITTLQFTILLVSWVQSPWPLHSTFPIHQFLNPIWHSPEPFDCEVRIWLIIQLLSHVIKQMMSTCLLMSESSWEPTTRLIRHIYLFGSCAFHLFIKQWESSYSPLLLGHLLRG